MLFIRGGSAALAALASAAASADGRAGSQVFMSARPADVGLKMHLMAEASGAAGVWDLDYEENDIGGGGSDDGSSFISDDGSSYRCDAVCFDYLETCSMAGLCFGAAETVKRLAGRDIECDVRGSVSHPVSMYVLLLFMFSCCFASFSVSAVTPSTNLDRMIV
jgi:hypothetical protein